jgi:hypothetical protein
VSYSLSWFIFNICIDIRPWLLEHNVYLIVLPYLHKINNSFFEENPLLDYDALETLVSCFPLGSCMSCSSTMKMEIIRPSETTADSTEVHGAATQGIVQSTITDMRALTKIICAFFPNLFLHGHQCPSKLNTFHKDLRVQCGWLASNPSINEYA